MPREFGSQEEFKQWVKAWCDRQSLEVNCTFAARNAALILPNIFGGRPEELIGFSFDLLLLRGTLSSLVRGRYASSDIVDSAASAADFSDGDAVYSAASAADCARYAASAAAYADARFDTSAASTARCATLAARYAIESSYPDADAAASAASFAIAYVLDMEGVSGISVCPLWDAIERPEMLEQNWEGLRAEWQSDPSMAFWVDWYDGLLEGRAPDWELWREIALIADHVWESGPKAVAEAIKEIQATLLTKRAPLAEEMVFDQDKRTFKTVPIEIDTPDLFRVSLERSEFAYSLAIGGNGLSEACYEAKILSHTFKTCRDDPQTVEMNFMQVAGSLKRQVECHEYPDSPEITGLADTLFQAALDIRATHPAVKEAREKRAQAALHEATPEQKEALADALPVLKAISDDKLAEEFELDFGQVLNSSAGPVPNTAPKLPGADATHRIGNRVAKMSLLTKSSDVAKALDGSGGYKALTISMTLHTLVGIILRLLGG